MDKSLFQIANSLNKTYENQYIELYPKNNVIFKNGQTVLTSEAQSSYYVNLYKQELEEYAYTLRKELSLQNDNRNKNKFAKTAF